EDRDRQVDQLGHRLHLAVAADGDLHGDVAVFTQDVLGAQGEMAGAPFFSGGKGRYPHHTNEKHEKYAPPGNLQYCKSDARIIRSYSDSRMTVRRHGGSPQKLRRVKQ